MPLILADPVPQCNTGGKNWEVRAKHCRQREIREGEEGGNFSDLTKAAII